MKYPITIRLIVFFALSFGIGRLVAPGTAEAQSASVHLNIGTVHHYRHHRYYHPRRRVVVVAPHVRIHDEHGDNHGHHNKPHDDHR